MKHCLLNFCRLRMSIHLKLFMYRIPEVFRQFDNIIAGESNRLDGVSEPPYSSLNMGLSTGDSVEKVWQNRKLFFESLGIDISRVALSHQVHDDKILLAKHPGNFSGFDAVITNVPDVFAAVSTADCVPVLVYDKASNAVAAIHAGWPGTHKSIVLKTLQNMQQEFGTRGDDCFISIGTCIDESVYEVGEEVAGLFADQHKKFYPEKNKFHLRLKAANFSQIASFGVPENQVEISPYCTFVNNDLYFSHRKEKGKTGRMLSVIGIKG